MSYLYITAGIIYLLFGGDLLVRGSVALARRAHVSPLVVALTVVAFGTSVPELVVALQAALTGHPGIVLGNVVGSNIANVLLVAGAGAAFYPLAVGQASDRRDSAIMIAASVLLVLLCLRGEVGRLSGGLLFAGLVWLSIFTAREAARAYRDADITIPLDWVLGIPSRLGTIWLFIGLGIVWLPLGAKTVVDAAVEIATQLGVSDTVVGLTIIAFSTSLPELATTVVASLQRRREVAIGTVIGSNVFNILGIMAVAALVSPAPIAVASSVLVFDLPVMLGVSLLLSAFVWMGRPIGRAAGVLFVTGYVAYIGILFASV